MRRFQLLAPIFLATVAIFATTMVAGASNAVTTTHFAVAYDTADFGLPFGFLTCDGQRTVKSGPNGFVKDSETCAVTGASEPLPNGHYPLDPIEGVPQWLSDYELFVDPGGVFCLRPAITGTLVVTGNGQTWNAEAFYDPSFICL